MDLKKEKAYEALLTGMDFAIKVEARGQHHC